MCNGESSCVKISVYLSGQGNDESGQPQTGPPPGLEGKVDRLPMGYKYEEVLPQGDYVGHPESSRFGSYFVQIISVSL